MYFRKKPAVVQAFHFGETDPEHYPDWFLKSPHVSIDFLPDEPDIKICNIQTKDGVVMAVMDDWIVRESSGELSSCKHSVFIKIYEMV